MVALFQGKRIGSQATATSSSVKAATSISNSKLWGEFMDACAARQRRIGTRSSCGIFSRKFLAFVYTNG